MRRTRSQAARYRDHYARQWRWLFRFDVRYRCRRLREVLRELDLDVEGKRVLDVGFGTGQLLRCLPTSCALYGAEVSVSAVEAAQADPRHRAWRRAEFSLVREGEPGDLPPGPFDIILSSHTIEHVPDDGALLRAVHERLAPGGVLLLFVPIEEPNYNPDHVRNYSPRSIQTLVKRTGFDVFFREDSMHVNGHVWKVITIPSRRRWPVARQIVHAVRLVTLSMIPYRMQRMLDCMLAAIGVGPRQCLLLARK